jgi:hypothetical protein
MNLISLQHLVRAVRTLAADREMIVLGSASLLEDRVMYARSANGAAYRSPGQRPGTGCPKSPEP